MKPIEQFIADPTTQPCVRTFFAWAVHGAANDETPPPLFANYKDCRVRVVTAKHTGFVGITTKLGKIAPERFVSIMDLVAFLDAPYPARLPGVIPHSATQPARVETVVSDCCDRAGVTVDEFSLRDRMKERCFAVAELYSARLSIAAIGRALGIMPTAVNRCLDKVGLRGADNGDRRYVRSLWSDGPKQVGTAPGMIPSSVAHRLSAAGFAVVVSGRCEAALRHLFPEQQVQRRAA